MPVRIGGDSAKARALKALKIATGRAPVKAAGSISQ
jgi:hypothetical protein